ncbi:MAG: GIY-YIG nuclease family protein [Candidatus Syntropharchaeia archaeon]
MRGTYVLLIKAPEKEIRVGKLGIIRFKSGFYAYVGSALNGIEARIKRHLSNEKKIHWHIDYLLTISRIETVFYAETAQRMECDIAESLSDLESVREFGCSDCTCESHLFFSPEKNYLERRISDAFERCGLEWEKEIVGG